MSNGRAIKGGQVGLNGERYEGGQFLPSTTQPKQARPTREIAAGKKQAVAPYVWQATPQANLIAIYGRVESCVTDNRRDCQYVKGTGFVGLQLTPRKIMLDSLGQDAGEDWKNFIAMLCEKFNAGEVWYELASDPYHYLNQKEEQA